MKAYIKKLILSNFWLERLFLKYNSLRMLRKIKKQYSSASFGSDVEIINWKNLKLGNNVSIQDRVVLHCGGVEWCNNTGGIEIGDNSVISPNCIFWGCGAVIKIGKNFDCGPSVKIFASRTKYEDLTRYPERNNHLFKDVVIGDDVIIFTNVVINPGVTVGDGAVIGANSLVLQDIPPFSVVAGSPAKFIKIRG
jgi:acetyltransferase-like isoleucine patch superfamily enzyme